MKPIPLAGLSALLLTGCQTSRPLYYWGHYESLIYEGYAKPGKASLEDQALTLQEDIQKAAAVNLPAHPGLHAQLGYVYFQQGHLDLARKEFETEKALFPESAPFMDRMLTKIAIR